MGYNGYIDKVKGGLIIPRHESVECTKQRELINSPRIIYFDDAFLLSGDFTQKLDAFRNGTRSIHDGDLKCTVHALKLLKFHLRYLRGFINLDHTNRLVARLQFTVEFVISLKKKKSDQFFFMLWFLPKKKYLGILWT